MDDVEVKREIARLMEEIGAHNLSYFIFNTPTISDIEYDYLVRRLKELELKYPKYSSENSPTQTVGVESKLHKLTHRKPMLSLNNVYTIDELIAFNDKIQLSLKDSSRMEYLAEPKVDGLAINLSYQNGILVTASTRGNGTIGQNVTEAALALVKFPSVLLSKHAPPVLEVRGEVYITKSELEALNRRLKAADKNIYIGTRSAAAGILQQGSSKLTKGKLLSLVCYGVGEGIEALKVKTQDELMDVLGSWGLPISPMKQVVCGTKGCLDYYDYLVGHRGEIDYEMDGVVYKLNALATQLELGDTNRAPRWAIAHKFQAVEGVTRLESIEFKVGKGGYLTPVATLTPLLLKNSRITKATLHNLAEVRKKDIRIRDMLLIALSGDVIPYVKSVVAELRDDSVSEVPIPDRCPDCGGELEISDDFKSVKCVAGTACATQLKRCLERAVSKEGLDVPALGPAVLEKLIKAGLVKRLDDIFKLTVEQISSIDGIGAISSEKIVKNVVRSKNTELSRLIYALGIDGVGVAVSKRLASKFTSLIDMFSSPKDSFEQMPGIGLAIGTAIVEFYSELDNVELVDNLSKLIKFN